MQTMQTGQKCVIAVLLVAMAGQAAAGLVVENGEVREQIPGASSTAAYMTLRNTGSEPLLLIRVTSPVAGKVTLHSTMNHNGMMHMMGMDSLNIPANGTVVLQEGALHMMLEEAVQPITAGNVVDLTLQLGDGTDQTVSLPVRSVLKP